MFMVMIKNIWFDSDCELPLNKMIEIPTKQ